MTENRGQIFRLYQWPHCSFCWRVRSAAERLGVQLELIDTTRSPDAEHKLRKNLGRGTVPVLSFDCGGQEQFLPESLDIIRFLERYVAADRPGDPCNLPRL
jgi:glutaredoxin 2